MVENLGISSPQLLVATDVSLHWSICEDMRSLPSDQRAMLTSNWRISLELRCWIVSQYHNTRVAGHAGQWKTLELVACNYWWAQMSCYISKYVKTCNLSFGPRRNADLQSENQLFSLFQSSIETPSALTSSLSSQSLMATTQSLMLWIL